MADSSKISDATIVAHDGTFPYGAVVPPIVQTSLFAFESYQDLVDCFRGENDLPIYSRGRNPTVREFELKLAALEGADDARVADTTLCAFTMDRPNLNAGQTIGLSADLTRVHLFDKASGVRL